MRILINDIHVRFIGHNLGYIQNILRYLEENPSKDEYLFVLNPEAKRIPSIRCSSPKVTIIFLSDEEFEPYHSMSLPNAASILWKSITRYAHDFRAERVILLELDIFQYEVGKVQVPFDISGIMLRPYPRVMAVENTLQSKIQTYIRRYKKIAVVWWMCRNKKLSKVFILNDAFSVSKMNKKFDTNVFTYLPDPIFDYPSKKDFNIREKYGINSNKKIFLVFGSIDEKKNVVNILKAFQDLNLAETKQYCLMIVGRIDASYQAILELSLTETYQKQPSLQIIVENQFVADDEMECFVGQSDIISLAYINFFSSSGVIGLASRHHKPIIAAKYGVVGYQTEEYELGLKVNPYDISELTKAIRYFLRNEDKYPKKANELIQNHSRDKFIETLLEI
jgi:glycosyltransferase involved in cell wall biosynthesis